MLGMRQARLPGHNRREQILGIAMDLFSRQGFGGTTTRQIAQASGVSEAIIFRHFPGKQELYWAVIEQKCRDAGQRQELLRQRLNQAKSDREVFAQIAEDILTGNRNDPSRVRLLLFAALENHQLSERFFQTYVAKYYEILAVHIARRVRDGAFRPVDPLLAARGFLGMVVYHFWMQELFGGKRHQDFDAHHVCRTLADIWLRGVEAIPRRNGRQRNGATHHVVGNGKRSQNGQEVNRSGNGTHLTVGKRS